MPVPAGQVLRGATYGDRAPLIAYANPNDDTPAVVYIDIDVLAALERIEDEWIAQQPTN